MHWRRIITISIYLIDTEENGSFTDIAVDDLKSSEITEKPLRLDYQRGDNEKLKLQGITLVAKINFQI